MSQPATGATRAPAPPPDPQHLPTGAGRVGGIVAPLGTRDAATVREGTPR